MQKSAQQTKSREMTSNSTRNDDGKVKEMYRKEQQQHQLKKSKLKTKKKKSRRIEIKWDNSKIVTIFARLSWIWLAQWHTHKKIWNKRYAMQQITLRCANLDAEHRYWDAGAIVCVRFCRLFGVFFFWFAFVKRRRRRKKKLYGSCRTHKRVNCFLLCVCFAIIEMRNCINFYRCLLIFCMLFSSITKTLSSCYAQTHTRLPPFHHCRCARIVRLYFDLYDGLISQRNRIFSSSSFASAILQ